MICSIFGMSKFFSCTILTLTKTLLLLSTAIIVLASCNSIVPDKHPVLMRGEYELHFALGEVDIPVRLSIDSARRWKIHNWNESILIDSVGIFGNTFHADMPLFNTSLDGNILTDTTFSGRWTDHSRDSLYEIPFKARRIGDIRSSEVKDAANWGEKFTYQAVFSPDSGDDSCSAVGIFYRKNNAVVGTFLTESGDYRFLEGEDTGKSLHLSSFDGAHLFYFCANVEGDYLTDGKFFSGKHWSEEWRAFLNPTATLRNPDSLTFVQNNKVAFSFTVQDFEGDTIVFDSSKFAGQVTVVQIFGSWCPNCTDESKFMKTIYEKYHAEGLQVIPVAFERSPEIDIARASVYKQFQELGLEYRPYYGGHSNKGHASEIFSKLTKITSYPTAIIVDKKGVVRKIHTGFYGPVAGDLFDKHCAEISLFIEKLLNENPSPL